MGFHRQIRLMVAPPAMQPGGYVMKAYADRSEAATPAVDLRVDGSERGGFAIELGWDCARMQGAAGAQTDRFVDACALLCPLTPDAPWITMGAPGQPVEAVYWRADRGRPWRMRAEGLGTMQRGEAPPGWSAQCAWDAGRWRVRFVLDAWEALAVQRRLGVAVWQGQHGERAGLKSVSDAWLPLG